MTECDRKYSGSSPLARGLQDRRSAAISNAGIIPARAGFTPLPPTQTYACGIIPARAGFTRRPACSTRWRPDHPRSRGVYSSSSILVSFYAGSSPLARGLRCVKTYGAQHKGIIPARAGFTTGAPTSGPTEGIIPARAGFTLISDSDGNLEGDHPRSRGVYRRKPCREEPSDGSSPLARGLRPVDGAAHQAVRIIPARAGFTRSGPGVGTRPWDHPRSRGVYTCESLESQRTRSLPDPRRLHCRPRARSAELR